VDKAEVEGQKAERGEQRKTTGQQWRADVRRQKTEINRRDAGTIRDAGGTHPYQRRTQIIKITTDGTDMGKALLKAKNLRSATRLIIFKLKTAS
jgi:hypothetical protein